MSGIKIADTPQSRLVIAMSAISQCNDEGHHSKEVYWRRLGDLLDERYGDGSGRHTAQILRTMIERGVI